MSPCHHIPPPLAIASWEEPLALIEGRAPCLDVVSQFGLLAIVAACIFGLHGVLYYKGKLIYSKEMG